MVFGDTQTFAIELELDEDYGGPWLFGRFCYWVGGVRVGDYELGASLRDVLSGMKWAVYDCGKREGGKLCGSSPQATFYRLDASLYGCDECDGGDSFGLPDSPARFEITIPVEVFNEWKAFLIECDGKAQILYKNADDTGVKAVTIPAGMFDEVIKKAYDHLDRLHEREIA